MIGQATMHDALKPTADPAWVICGDGDDPLRESCLESRFAVSNGFLGVRGGRAIARGARSVEPTRMYVAGLFDTPGTDRATAALIPASDWLQVHVAPAERPLADQPGETLSRRLVLDMRRGALLTDSRHVQASGIHATVRTLRLACFSDRAVAVQLFQIDVERGEVEVTLEACFDAGDLARSSDALGHDLGVWHTHQSNLGLALAAALSLHVDGAELAPSEPDPLRWIWRWTTRPGQTVNFVRLIAVTRGDRPGADPGPKARERLAIARSLGWRGVLAEHEAAWERRWACSDVELDGDDAAQQALRFAAYHLNSAANPNDERVSIGARALTGDGYRGHVFWDTEIFLLPFYILTWPEAARTLLMYRFHTLDGARAKASRLGWRGALYAWESAVTGAEETPEQVIGPDRRVVDVLCGTQEQHISADIAYAVWQYWQASADENFLLDAGAEILLETGRFWASRAQPEADGLHHIRGVIGPDEYHEHIDDNAFTNVMARWNIRRALDVAVLLRARWPDRWTALSARLRVDDAELAQWRNVAEHMATGLDPRTGLFEQFVGFSRLEDIDVADYAGRSVPMDVVIGRERTAQSQVVKQADVVALLGLLPEEFAHESGAANFRHYEPRCSHGSSLSRAMHGLVAARLGETDMALRYFHEAAEIDLGDSDVATAGGVHIAALGGVWMATVFGFAGVTLRNDGIAISPHLPTAWSRLIFCLQWRGRRLRVRIVQAAQLVSVDLLSGAPMRIHVDGAGHELARDGALRVDFGGPTAPTRPEPILIAS